MKTAILYASTHHGNTRKVVRAIAEASPDVTLLDVTRAAPDGLSGFDRIGLASGVYYGTSHTALLRSAQEHLPGGVPVFFLHTAGSPRRSHCREAERIAAGKGCPLLGVYFCKGFDTFGPFRLIGGIAKGHPTARELQAAVAFYRGL